MHIASFAGFAPVNNPVIAVAIIMDSPKGAYYGADVSAPVFADVAQQVLEYLGVPHDVDLRPAAKTAKAAAPIKEDDTEQDENDVKALYDAVNDLPSDDPLRAPPPKAAAAAQQPAPQNAAANAKQSSQAATTQTHLTPQQTTAAQNTSQSVTVAEGTRLRVPSLLGLPVRQVIEQAAAAGLEVQIVGNGTARQQAPDPGTMVAPGTKIVVRCKQ